MAGYSIIALVSCLWSRRYALVEIPLNRLSLEDTNLALLLLFLTCLLSPLVVSVRPSTVSELLYFRCLPSTMMSAGLTAVIDSI